MKIFISCLLLLVSGAVYSQSKKEMQEQINSLKAQVEQLKKPKQVDFNNEHVKASYGLGVLMAANFKKQGTDSLDVDAVALGMKDIFQNKVPRMNEQECMSVVQPYMQKNMEQKGNKVKEEGKAFLAANMTKEGVTTTASGLQYKVLTQGSGKTPGQEDNVTVNYTGKLLDGTVFDSSLTTGKPATFGVGNVIAGWTEALKLMREGDKWTIFVPSQLAYGERGAGSQIPPFATLIFEVELIKVN